MSSFFSSDGSSSLQFAVIFLVIFVVLAGLAFAFRRLAGRGLSLSSKAGQRERQPRLGIVDIYELDRQRQLILLRRDNVEHLLLVGGPNDVVVERNITRGARIPAEAEARPDPPPAYAAVAPTEVAPGRALPEPVLPEPVLPEPVLPEPAFPERAPAEPAFTMPVVVEPPLPGSSAAPPRVGAPLTLESEPGIDPLPPRRAEPASARPTRRMPPPLANLVPGLAGERGRAPDAPPSLMPEPPAPPEAEPPPAAPALAPVAVSAPRPIDAAILSDMARQLEEALRRPASAVTPPAPPLPLAPPEPPAPVEPAPPPPLPAPEPLPAPPAPEPAPAAAPTELAAIAAPRPVEAAPAVDPVAAAMAAQTPPVSDELFDEPAREREPEPDAVAAPAAAPLSEPLAEPPAEPLAEPLAKPLAEPSPEPPPKAHPPKPSSQNPFSVEEIEAEFARLLGRPLDRKS